MSPAGSCRNATSAIAGELLREVKNRVEFLNDVGLEYLTLARGAATLSNGEAQRIRLASQLGSGLCGVLYVLDEPTIGLHPRDNTRLLAALHKLRDLGNTLIVVEHDREVIEGSDYVCDFGPGGRQTRRRDGCSGDPGPAGSPPRVADRSVLERQERHSDPRESADAGRRAAGQAVAQEAYEPQSRYVRRCCGASGPVAAARWPVAGGARRAAQQPARCRRRAFRWAR